jgi:hypothetical protein
MDSGKKAGSESIEVLQGRLCLNANAGDSKKS